MPKKAYELAHEDGQEWASGLAGAPVAVGDEFEAELEQSTETAVVAAGWVSEPEKKKKGG